MKRITFAAALVLLLVSCMMIPTPPGGPTPTPPPSGSSSCTITAANNPVTIYHRPSAAADKFGMMQPGDTAQATAKTADGFYGFDPGVAQAGNIGVFRLRWVLKTQDLTTDSSCAGIPVVVGPIAGICYAMIDHDTIIYSKADSTSAPVTTLHAGDYAMVTAHASGWFTLDLNVGSPSLSSAGYLKESELGGFNGPCDAF